jgi:hypothetical protein
MAYPVTLNGRTYTSADFDGQAYVAGLPDALQDFVSHAGGTASGTSTTSITIGTGSKVFTTQSNKQWAVGTPLRIASTSAPSTNFMDGIVTAYSSTTLTVNVVGVTGSGTIASWTISLGGSGYALPATVAVANGGTGATAAATALSNLGALPLAGGTMTGTLTLTGSNGSIATNAAGDQISYSYNGFNYLTASGAAATLQLQASGAGGSVTVATNGVERLRAASDGTITVGTSTKLTVNSFIAAFQNTGTSAVGSTNLVGRFSADANASGQYLVKSRGASIGTHGLVSSGDQVGNIAWYASDGAAYQPVAYLRAEVDGTAAAGDMPGRVVIGTTADGGVTTTERMRIDNLGNTFHNVTAYAVSSDTKLVHLKGPNSGSGFAAFVAESGVAAKQAVFECAGAAGDVIIGTQSTNTTGYAALFAGGVEGMRLTTSSELLVGTTALLGVAGTTGALVARHVFGSRHAIRCEDNATTLASQIGFYNTNGMVGQITTTGSATAYGTSSDYRLKENEVPISDGLTRLAALQPYRLNFIASPDETVDAFFAHEVQAVVPEAVVGDLDGEDWHGNPIYQSIDQSKLVPLLVAAVKELAADYAAYKAAHP